jgi:two-component system, NarL family, nitrate/nitrite response regulator NarL
VRRVLLADDHPFVLTGVEALLRDSDYEIVAIVNDGRQALEALATARPDILILDVAMKDYSGIDVLQTLRSRGDDRAVILLTASLDDDRLMQALKLGVRGIVLKEGAQHLLLRCLDEVRAGGRWIEHNLLQRAMDMQLSAERSPAKSGIDSLTARQRAIAGLIAKGRRNREVADELGLTEGTVKVYLHGIYQQLDISNRTELALLVRNSEPNRP